MLSETRSRLREARGVFFHPPGFPRSLDAADEIIIEWLCRLGERPLDEIFAGAPRLSIALLGKDARVAKEIVRIDIDHREPPHAISAALALTSAWASTARLPSSSANRQEKKRTESSAAFRAEAAWRCLRFRTLRNASVLEQLLGRHLRRAGFTCAFRRGISTLQLSTFTISVSR